MALLARLIDTFSDTPENVATRALHHVLTSHAAARRAFVAMAASFGAPLPADLKFQLQVRDAEHGQPDLIATDQAGRAVLVVEGKFWAGLTEHQPVSYISLLPNNRSGVVLFLAPAERVPALTAQLAERFRARGIPIGPGLAEASFTVDAHAVGVLAWMPLLCRMLEVARTQGDDGAVSDVLQLLGLCEHIEESAFIPFRPEEITALDVPRRMLDLSRVLTAFVEAGVAHQLWSRGRAGYSNCTVSYGITVGPLTAYAQFNADLWRRFKLSPLWISTNVDWPANKGLAADAAGRLRAALAYLGPRYIDGEDGEVYIALELKPGTAEEELVSDLLAQARTIVQHLHGSELFVKEACAVPGK